MPYTTRRCVVLQTIKTHSVSSAEISPPLPQCRITYPSASGDAANTRQLPYPESISAATAPICDHISKMAKGSEDDSLGLLS
jgi:hypothetical protein